MSNKQISHWILCLTFYGIVIFTFLYMIAGCATYDMDRCCREYIRGGGKIYKCEEKCRQVNGYWHKI